MRTCIYCGTDKQDKEFSDEHIWPDALGGDFLADFWRTDVCQSCNSLCGLFVDGSFIRSWAGRAERATGALEYLTISGPRAGVLPLDYLGVLQNLPMSTDEVADYWAGPCGAIIIHIRPADKDGTFEAYAGGDPRAKKARAGRAYMALTSGEFFWVVVSLASFKAHFQRARRFVTNAQLPPEWAGSFEMPDPDDPIQKVDLAVVKVVTEAGHRGETVRAKAIFNLDLGNRFLAKVALATGFKLFGHPFVNSHYGRTLRSALREANFLKRKQLPVHGTGFLASQVLAAPEATLAWPGAWVLVLTVIEKALALTVVAPSGRAMTIMVSNDPTFVDTLEASYRTGLIWLTIPALGRGTGPIPLPDYLAHKLNTRIHPELAALDAQRRDPATLPRCTPRRLRRALACFLRIIRWPWW